MRPVLHMVSKHESSGDVKNTPDFLLKELFCHTTENIPAST